MATLKLFIDHASQPSRAILVFCLINKIPHEVVETRIGKAEVSHTLLSIFLPNLQR